MITSWIQFLYMYLQTEREQIETYAKPRTRISYFFQNAT
jgi:hypothetical protein